MGGPAGGWSGTFRRECADGLGRAAGGRYTVSVQTNGGAQAVDVMVPAAQLDPKWQRHTITADVDAIRKALLAGEVVEDCVLAQRGSHLRIR